VSSIMHSGDNTTAQGREGARDVEQSQKTCLSFKPYSLDVRGNGKQDINSEQQSRMGAVAPFRPVMTRFDS